MRDFQANIDDYYMEDIKFHQYLASWFMGSQHWLKWRQLCSSRQQAISWTNVDQGPWVHMLSINHNTLNNPTCWICVAWWRHQMGTFYALLTLCAGNSPHNDQWRGASIFSLICTWTSDWVNNRDADDLRRHRSHYDVPVMVRAWMVNVVHLNQHLATQ